MSRVIHFEILSDDPPGLAAFYADVFGWKVHTGGGAEQRYWPVTTGAEGTPGINGGFMARCFQQPVINTVHVDDVEAALARVVEAGGKTMLGPHDVPGVGRHVYCADPAGNLFGMMQPLKSA